MERILVEADLPDEVNKLGAYGRSLPGLRELLGLLMRPDGAPGRQLRRQVAFLFDFDQVEHTTVVGLTLRDILKDARQKLRPWELEGRAGARRKIRGFRWARLPALAYSQAFCFYKVLPEHTDGPAIGLAYE